MIAVRETVGGREYARLFQRDKGAMFYQSPFWLEILKETLRLPVRILCTWEGDRLRAAVPFMISPGGSSGPVINTLPFFGSIGGMVSDRVGAEEEIHLTSLLQALVRKARSVDATSLNVICRPGHPLEHLYREILNPDFEDSRTTYVLDLPTGSRDSEEILMQGFAGRTRTAIRKAMKHRFEVAKTADPRDAEDLYILHCQNIDAVGGIRKPRSFMEAVRSRLGRGCAELWVVKSDGDVIAGALFFVFRETAEYYMTGLSPSFRQCQPLSLLVYEAMKDFVARGIRFFNFGGTWPTQEGLRRFKSGWGARPLPYHYFVKSGSSLDSLLKWSAPRIFARYPYFYVIPYRSLCPSPGEGKRASLQ